jgi:hypothetical protein
MGYLLLEEAEMWERKIPVAKHFVNEALGKARMHAYAVKDGDYVPIKYNEQVMFDAYFD